MRAVSGKASLDKMRLLICISFILFALTTFGQKNIRKAYILVDGKPTSYKDYKNLISLSFQRLRFSLEMMKHLKSSEKKGRMELYT
jgi:c-di-GMP-related signal transduction protein